MANVIDPYALAGSLESDIIESRLGVIVSTVRPFDKQRAQQVTRGPRAIAPTVRLATSASAQHRMRSARAAGVVISSRRP
jgi:hypothetical protein